MEVRGDIMNVKILFLFIFIAIILVGCKNSPDETNELIPTEVKDALTSSGVNTNYDVTLQVNPQDKTVIGSMTVYTLNDTNQDQSNIYFHLYPNAFREDAERDNYRAWYSLLGDNPEPGYLEIKGVKVNEEEENFVVNDTILEIPLNWKKDDIAVINLSFELKVPLNNAAMSYDSNAIWLGNSLPVKSVYDEEGWNTDPYYPIGDPFYNDMANYQVDITVPSGYQVTNTGMDVEPEVSGEQSIYKTEANKVRSFAMIIMDEEYAFKETKFGDVTIRTWYRKSLDSKEAIDRFHSVSENAIDYFSAIYGQYPYEDYDVIPTRGFFGGMELPGMSLIQGSYFIENRDYGVDTVAHEAAHQWWFHVVGNNQIDEPWLDESLTQYSTSRFLDQFHFDNYYHENYLQVKDSGQIEELKDINQLIGNQVDQFASWDTYGDIIYTVGPEMFRALEDSVGPDKMDQILSRYYENHMFSLVDGDDLIQTFMDELGPEVKDYFVKWLNNEPTTFSY
jgi:hypothetical protein